MQKYELMVIAVPELSKKAQETLTSEVKKEIEGIGGKDVEVDVWGKRKFAYLIKKQVEGLYILFSFEAPSDKIEELNRKLRLKEEVLRFLLTVKEKS